MGGTLTGRDRSGASGSFKSNEVLRDNGVEEARDSDGEDAAASAYDNEYICSDHRVRLHN